MIWSLVSILHHCIFSGHPKLSCISASIDQSEGYKYMTYNTKFKVPTIFLSCWKLCKSLDFYFFQFGNFRKKIKGKLKKLYCPKWDRQWTLYYFITSQNNRSTGRLSIILFQACETGCGQIIPRMDWHCIRNEDFFIFFCHVIMEIL